MSRDNPYIVLRNACREWAMRVVNPHSRHMFTYYGADDQTKRWKLDDLYQRVAATNQLDYDVMVRCENGNLVLEYVKRPPLAPWAIRP